MAFSFSLYENNCLPLFLALGRKKDLQGNLRCKFEVIADTYEGDLLKHEAVHLKDSSDQGF